MKKSELIKIIKECINENQIENKEVDILKKLSLLLNKIDFSTTEKGHEIAMKMEQLLNTLLDLKGVSHVFTERRKSIKEHGESDMTNPEEKREVQIGKEIKESLAELSMYEDDNGDVGAISRNIESLADELIKMHGQVK